MYIFKIFLLLLLVPIRSGCWLPSGLSSLYWPPPWTNSRSNQVLLQPGYPSPAGSSFAMDLTLEDAQQQLVSILVSHDMIEILQLDSVEYSSLPILRRISILIILCVQDTRSILRYSHISRASSLFSVVPVRVHNSTS